MRVTTSTNKRVNGTSKKIQGGQAEETVAKRERAGSTTYTYRPTRSLY